MEPAHRWAAIWKSAWENLDTEAIVSLYAIDALLSTEPFREPFRGREGVRVYVSTVFGEGEDPHVDVGKPIVDGARAAVPWWASLREEGTDTTLSGTSILRFDENGLVVEQWDSWNVIRGRRLPPEGWGPFNTPIN